MSFSRKAIDHRRRHPYTDLSEDDVREIRKMREHDGMFYSEIVSIFERRGKCIHKEGIKSICRRKTWREVV